MLEMAKLIGNLYSIPLLKQSLRALGKNYSKICPYCSSNRFDAAMAFLLKDEFKLGFCPNCEKFARNLSKLLKAFFSIYGIDQKTVKQIYSNAKLRKVIKNFFKGLAIFGFRKPFVMGAPLSVVWNLTSNCNLRCSHCFADARFDQISEKDLNTEEAKKVIKIFGANDVVTVNFCGGEPLLREDLYDLIKFAQKYEIHTSISTNATLLTKKICKKLYNSGIRSVTISLDGFDSKNHDRLRNVTGSYEQALNGIMNAAEFGKFEELIIATTLTNYNYNEIEQIYEFAQDLGATRYYLGRLLPTGRGKYYMEHDPNKLIKRKVLKSLANKLINSVQGKGTTMALTRGMPYFSRICYELSNGKIYPLCELITGYETQLTKAFNDKAANFIQRVSSVFSGCASGLFYIGLNSTGNVLPCATASHLPLGNVLEEGLHNIWVNNPTLNLIRKRNRKKGRCKRCFGRDFCGGCRLTAYNLTGDWNGSDLSCPYSN